MIKTSGNLMNRDSTVLEIVKEYRKRYVDLYNEITRENAKAALLPEGADPDHGIRVPIEILSRIDEGYFGFGYSNLWTKWTFAYIFVNSIIFLIGCC